MKETSSLLLLNVIFIRMQRPELEKENAVTFSQIRFWGRARSAGLLVWGWEGAVVYVEFAAFHLKTCVAVESL